MGYGYIALAYFLMMFPLTISTTIFSTSNLSLIGFAFLFMGLYQIQQRIQNRKLFIAVISSVLLFMTLCFQDTRWSIIVASIVEPVILLNLLYSTRNECSEKTKKQIRYFTILYLIMFVGVYLSLTLMLFYSELAQAILFILVCFRIFNYIYFIMLVLSINRQLKDMELLPVHENPLSFQKKHSIIMLVVILLSAGILYGTQSLYLSSMQITPSSAYQDRIYEGSTTNSRIAGLVRISKNQNDSDFYNYEKVNFYTKDETIANQVKLMKYQLYVDGKPIKEEPSDKRFMKPDIVKVEKQNNGEYRIALTGSHDMMEYQTDSRSQISMHVQLYDEQEKLILEETYPVKEHEEHVYHGNAQGITITELYTGNTAILQAPIIKTNIFQMAQTKGYTQVEMYIEYLQYGKVMARSNTIQLTDVPWEPFVHQHIDEGQIRYTSWDDRVMTYEQTITYDQAVIVMKYQGEGMHERTFHIPLQESKP